MDRNVLKSRTRSTCRSRSRSRLPGGGGVVVVVVDSDGFQQHRPAILVEEFRRGINVVVGARVGAADDHDRVAFCGRRGRVVDAVVVDGGLEEMGVGFEPIVSS